MLTKLFFGTIAGVRVERIWREDQVLHLAAMTTGRYARCPLCRRRSKRVHSRYARTLRDLPCVGARVTVHLRTRRFVCRMRWCRRKIFTERLPALMAPSARRTTRLHEHFEHTGMALGGAPGARQATAAGMPVSRRTLLRVVRAVPLPASGPIKVLGVDDWAMRKGRTYGTILVDLQAHAVVDLLPDRTAAVLAAWLRGHPGTEIISRDRAGAYADGARQGAPQATQIADRWHLMKNMTDVVDGVLRRQHAVLRAAAEAVADHTLVHDRAEGAVAAHEDQAAAPPSVSLTRAQRDKQSRRARRQHRYEAVVALHQQGRSQRDIAATLGLGRRTVRFFLRAEGFPERAAGRRRRPLLDPYLPYLRERWAAGCHNAAQLWRDLHAQGFAGAVRNVRECVAAWRAQPGKGGRQRPSSSSQRAPVPPAIRSYSARQTTWLLLRESTALEPEDALFVAHLTRLSSVIHALQELARAFHTLVRTQNHGALEPWLCAAEQSGIPEICGFVAGLRADAAAVEAALLLPWSQGQTEGHVNKLKVLKRQGFGRAKLDLLRQRLLHAS